MSVAILLAESTHESIIPVRWPALAGGARTGNAILALEPGRTIGWGVRNNDGAIASNMAESRVRRFVRGAIIFRPCLTWLEKVDARGAGAALALALLYRALAQGARR